VSPHLDIRNIRRQMQDINKYKKTIQGTSNRHIDISPIIAKNRIRRTHASQRRMHRNQRGHSK